MRLSLAREFFYGMVAWYNIIKFCGTCLHSNDAQDMCLYRSFMDATCIEAKLVI